MNELTTRHAILFSALLLSLSSLSSPAPALCAEVELSGEVEDQEPEPINRPETPGFRTDLGIQFAFGGHSCVGGGSNYASCSGTNDSWDTSGGLAGTLMARPFRMFSIGFDVSYYTMKYHQLTDNKWKDLLLGPVAKLHFPFRFSKHSILMELNFGLQVGFVKGVYDEKKRDDGNTVVNWKHDHLGAFLGVPLAFDYFPIPKLGVGLDFKLVRTFYTEVCFESQNVTTCRGVDDKAAEDNWELPASGIPNDKGVASYPWKLFWGLHVLYYL